MDRIKTRFCIPAQDFFDGIKAIKDQIMEEMPGLSSDMIEHGLRYLVEQSRMKPREIVFTQVKRPGITQETTWIDNPAPGIPGVHVVCDYMDAYGTYSIYMGKVDEEKGLFLIETAYVEEFSDAWAYFIKLCKKWDCTLPSDEELSYFAGKLKNRERADSEAIVVISDPIHVTGCMYSNCQLAKEPDYFRFATNADMGSRVFIHESPHESGKWMVTSVRPISKGQR